MMTYTTEIRTLLSKSFVRLQIRGRGSLLFATYSGVHAICNMWYSQAIMFCKIEHQDLLAKTASRLACQKKVILKTFQQTFHLIKNSEIS